jgi:hypothetical protein
MALDTARLAAELESLIADMPATVTHRTATFQAALTMATTGADIQEGGFLPSRDVALHVRATETTSAVKVGAKLDVLLQGVKTTYRVISVERSQDGQELIISCQSHRR